MRVESDTTRAIRVIYVPGLRDEYDILRRFGLWLWRFQVQSVRTAFVPMRWSNADDTYDEKVARVARAISNASSLDRIVLMGESAGGGMVIANWLDDSRVETIVTVCGKNRGKDSVGETTYRKNPAFRIAMTDVEKTVATSTDAARARILTIYSPKDTVVPLEDTLIPGARMMSLPTSGHGRTIFTVLFIYARRVVKAL